MTTVTNWLNSLAVSEINFAQTYILQRHDFPLANRCRKHHGFLYTVKGIERYKFYDKEIVTAPNSIIYLPKGSNFRINLESEDSHAICINFELHNTETHPPFCVKFENDETIKHLFLDAENTWKKKNIEYPSDSKCIFFRICSRMIRKCEHYINSDGYAKIAESVDYLHNHYMDRDFRIDSLFKIANISSRYYEKLFYQKFGKTPKEYVLDLKIECAKELLLQEKSSIKNAALQLGYSDIYHFGKMFKAKTGYTPGQYRKIYFL